MTKKLLLTIITTITIIAITAQSFAMTIVLDPGHGGDGGGEAVGAENGELKERELNLKIGLFLKEYLEQYEGVNIIMTRDDDSPITVYNRAMLARKNNADLLVSLHINDAVDVTQSGVECWVTANTSLPKYNKEMTELGEKVIENITDLGLESRGVKTRLRSDPNELYSDGTKADYYGVICFAMRGTKIDTLSQDENGDYYIDSKNGEVHTYIVNDEGKIQVVDSSASAKVEDGEGISTILIEHAFIKEDSEYLDTDEKLKALALADGKAIVDQYNLKLKAEPEQTEEEKAEEEAKKEEPTTPLDIYEDVYRNYVGTSAIAFRLKSKTDVISGNDLITAYPDLELKMNNETIKRSQTFKNGDIIKIDGKQYTIIIYGDVNSDGKISILDAVATLNHVKEKEVLTGAKFVSADANHNGVINILEAVNILNVVKEKAPYSQL